MYQRGLLLHSFGPRCATGAQESDPIWASVTKYYERLKLEAHRCYPQAQKHLEVNMFLELRRQMAEFIYPEGPQERRSLERRADIDSLTGLGNKAALERALPLAEADPNIAVLVFDMNNLGRANKCDGHRRGDALIRRAARTIQLFTKRLTGQCRAFRFGGDEFVVFCDTAYAAELCDELRLQFGKHSISDGSWVSLSGSHGFTFEFADRYLQGIKNLHKEFERQD